MKFLTTLFLILFGFSANLNAQIPGQSYIIQPNDWLSKISAKAYGNPHVYNRIIEGTNEKAIVDNSFQRLSNVNDLRIGQKVWIPDFTTGKVEETTIEKAAVDDVKLVTLPKTNCEIRIWYNYQVVAISKLNEKWKADGIDLKTRAEQAYSLRHNARVNARFMMQNPEEVKGLQARDIAKYGNPNGPSFEYLLKKNTDKGLSPEEGYQSIIDSSSRVSAVYNSECQ